MTNRHERRQLAKQGVKRLQQKIKRLEMQSQNSQEIYQAGWQDCALYVSATYEPLIQEWVEIEHITGAVGMLLEMYPHGLHISSDTGKQAGVKSILKDLALKLGDCLNRADIHSREMQANAGRDESIIDFSPAHDIRNAILDACNGKDARGERLRELVMQNPDKHAYVGIMAAATKRNRARQDTTQIIADRVKSRLDTGKASSVSQAVLQVYHDLDGLHEVDTIEKHYRRIHATGGDS